MVMVSKFSNSPDELSENDELREFELSGSDCSLIYFHKVNATLLTEGYRSHKWKAKKILALAFPW